MRITISAGLLFLTLFVPAQAQSAVPCQCTKDSQPVPEVAEWCCARVTFPKYKSVRGSMGSGGTCTFDIPEHVDIKPWLDCCSRTTVGSPAGILSAPVGVCSGQ